MHQRRPIQQATLLRVVGATAIAMLIAVILAQFPLCALYTPDDPEWFLFFCYLR